MYLDNKYTRIYYALVTQASSRNFKNKKEARASLGYVERHHIVPRSIGGDDSKSNLVFMTAREHFICHWLLTKMVDGELIGKMEMAINIMKAKTPKQHRYNTPITSRVFEKYKSLAAVAQSNSIKGIPQSAIHVKKRADAIRGIPHTEERKQAIKEGRAKGKKTPSWNKGKKYSNPSISVAKKGVELSKNHCKSIANSLLGKTWWTNGIIQKKSTTCPGDGFVSGRLSGSLDRDKNTYTLKHPKEGIVRITRKIFIKRYNLKAGNVSALLNKKSTQYKEWTLIEINGNPV